MNQKLVKRNEKPDQIIALKLKKGPQIYQIGILSLIFIFLPGRFFLTIPSFGPIFFWHSIFLQTTLQKIDIFS